MRRLASRFTARFCSLVAGIILAVAAQSPSTAAAPAALGAQIDSGAKALHVQSGVVLAQLRVRPRTRVVVTRPRGPVVVRRVVRPGPVVVERRRNRVARGVAIGVGAAIVGAIIASEAARASRDRGERSDWQRCADTYKSFDWDTGTYTNYEGEEVVCPYLR